MTSRICSTRLSAGILIWVHLLSTLVHWRSKSIWNIYSSHMCSNTGFKTEHQPATSRCEHWSSLQSSVLQGNPGPSHSRGCQMTQIIRPNTLADQESTKPLVPQQDKSSYMTNVLASKGPTSKSDLKLGGTCQSGDVITDFWWRSLHISPHFFRLSWEVKNKSWTTFSATCSEQWDPFKTRCHLLYVH